MRLARVRVFPRLRHALRHAALAMTMGSAAWIGGCGASSKPVPARPAKHAAAPAPAPSPVESATVVPPKSLASAPKTTAEHHRDFMSGCAKKPATSPDYCECAWGEFRKVFGDDDMAGGDMPAPKLEKVKSQVLTTCASKIPEEMVRDGFTKGCVGTKTEMQAYCDCTWTEFRKRFSAAELGDEATVTSERFVAARAPVVKACGNKMPESVSKDAFMKGCAKDAPSSAFCGCAWKELRKQASPGEIESGTFDQKVVFAQVEKGCGKLRPPAAK